MEQKSFFDKNTILVILICLGIWWGWQQYLEKKYPESMGGSVSQTEKVTETAPSDSHPSLNKDEKSQRSKAAQIGELTSSREVYNSQETLSLPAEKTWTYEDKV